MDSFNDGTVLHTWQVKELFKSMNVTFTAMEMDLLGKSNKQSFLCII